MMTAATYEFVRLSEALKQVERRERVEGATPYRLLGVRLDGGGPFLRETRLGSEISASTLSRVAEGDFIYSRLFAWRGAFGVVDEALDGCYVSNEFPTFRPISKRIDVRYLKYWFRTKGILKTVEADCSGSTPLTRNRYKEKFFLNLTIPLPPLEEQRRIVAKIERLAAKIEEARRLREQNRDTARQIWVSQARRLIVEQPSARWQELGNEVDLHGGGTPSKQMSHFWQGAIPWVTPKDMKFPTIKDSQDRITSEAIANSATKMIQPEAVLVVVRGMILAHTVPSAVLAVPATINQDMKALVSRGRIKPDFLCLCLRALNSELLAQVQKSGHDTRRLPSEALRRFRLPIPEFSEQHRLVEYLKNLQGKVDTLHTLQQQTSYELDALLPSTLDKALSGLL